MLGDWFSQVFDFAVLSVTIHSASESLNGWVYVLSWTMVALLLGYTLLQGSQVFKLEVLYAREIVELVKVMYVSCTVFCCKEDKNRVAGFGLGLWVCWDLGA